MGVPQNSLGKKAFGRKAEAEREPKEASNCMPFASCAPKPTSLVTIKPKTRARRLVGWSTSTGAGSSAKRNNLS